MTKLPVQIGMNGRFFPENWRPARDEIVFARLAGAFNFPARRKDWGSSGWVIHWRRWPWRCDGRA